MDLITTYSNLSSTVILDREGDEFRRVRQQEYHGLIVLGDKSIGHSGHHRKVSFHRLTSRLRFRDNLRDVIESGGLAERRYDTGLGTSKENLKSQKRVITES